MATSHVELCAVVDQEGSRFDRASLWAAGWGRHVESQRSGRRHDEFADEDGRPGALVADEVDESGHLDVGLALGVRGLGAVVGVDGDRAFDDDRPCRSADEWGFRLEVGVGIASIP